VVQEVGVEEVYVKVELVALKLFGRLSISPVCGLQREANVLSTVVHVLSVYGIHIQATKGSAILLEEKKKRQRNKQAKKDKTKRRIAAGRKERMRE
jgi:hypothetical protein